MSRQVRLWGRGGYYVLDIDEEGSQSVPASEKAAFLAYAPREMVWATYGGQTGPEAAARFREEARRWLATKKLNRLRAEGEKRNA